MVLVCVKLTLKTEGMRSACACWEFGSWMERGRFTARDYMAKRFDKKRSRGGQSFLGEEEFGSHDE